MLRLCVFFSIVNSEALELLTVLKLYHLQQKLQAVCRKNFLQELSYSKQIAHQLYTQYVDDIYSKCVILKPRLRVTQGHWKRKHCIDHARRKYQLSYLTLNIILTLKCGLKSLKTSCFKSLDTVSYSHSTVTMPFRSYSASMGMLPLEHLLIVIVDA